MALSLTSVHRLLAEFRRDLQRPGLLPDQRVALLDVFMRRLRGLPEGEWAGLLRELGLVPYGTVGGCRRATHFDHADQLRKFLEEEGRIGRRFTRQEDSA